MGACGGISYVVLKKGADYSQFSCLMRILPLNTSDDGVYDYDSYDPPKGNLFEAYWRDTYEAFSLNEDLMCILEDILEDFQSCWSCGLSLKSSYTWKEILEDWETCPDQYWWPPRWRLIAKNLNFLFSYFSERENLKGKLFNMTLIEWAKKVREMIEITGYQETWT